MIIIFQAPNVFDEPVGTMNEVLPAKMAGDEQGTLQCRKVNFFNVGMIAY